ncbi:hydroxypyruvate isomerase family protein [Neptunicoccus cionae]|uniref:hydroxypyruvate isomerase family protein n=1 Tax=Neptunicoccus cionae TaxID=2035344 RepID=UPI000C757E49|nr:TIM barrel protein [Amylibacter cionae]PLS21383.1 hydroxypyruvate isomerase [Amylibacter cionae]
MKLIANISMMFTELPLPDRLAAAAQAGFEGVEIQFPAAEEVSEIAAASAACGMPVTLINVPRGTGDAVGLACLPDQQEAFRDAVQFCAKQAEALKVRKVNVLSGRPPEGASRAACMEVLKSNLLYTADAMSEIGVRVMIEPVNRTDVPGFFLTGLAEPLALLAELSHPNLALQFDFYHMAITEPDLTEAVRQAGARIGHVQFADTPGRHEPGTGSVDFAAALKTLGETGYDGEVSAEYNPANGTTAGLDWMPEFKRMLT